MKKQFLILCGLIFVAAAVSAKNLDSGFNLAEYQECICMASHFKELPGIEKKYLAPAPKSFEKIYSSPVTGFENMWELWLSADSIAAISLRATVTNINSWLSNFHAGMVRAQGVCHLGKDYNYKLCDNPDAMVHAGWLASMLAMSDDILTHIDSCYKAGIKDFIVTGHSQGGAIAYLLTAFLIEKQTAGSLPKDIQFKTYCSGAPKPGDYAFACEYEYMTRNDWSLSVVNTEDWVPEVPLSIQKMDDFRATNPFAHTNELPDTLDFINKIKIKILFKSLAKPPRKAEKKLRKYLGTKVGKILEKEYDTYQKPTFGQCANYARTGRTIIFKPSAEYYERHPRCSKDFFEHHMYRSYYELSLEIK